MSHSKFSQGFSLIEVLLSVSLFALLVSGLAGGIIYLQQNVILAGQQNRALMLAEGGLEEARGIRDSGFNNLAAGSGTPEQVGIFTRQVDVADISASVKEVTSTVTWSQNLQRAGSIVLVTRLSDWRGN